MHKTNPNQFKKVTRGPDVCINTATLPEFEVKDFCLGYLYISLADA